MKLFMNMKLKKYLICGLLLTFSATSTYCLHCWNCSSQYWPTYCHTLQFSTKAYNYVLAKCKEDEVCYKDVIYYERLLNNGSYVLQERIKRGCTSFHQEWRIGECVFKEDFSPPFPGQRCLCQDKNYCNRGLTIKRNMNLMIIVILVLNLIDVNTI